MPNCDWGRPCDCKDCRKEVLTIECPYCSFNNKVSYLRNSAGLIMDRKGLSDYQFVEHTEPRKEMNCFKCKKLILNTPYYEKLEAHLCELELNAKNCEVCGVKSTETFFPLREKNGKTLCRNCINK